MSSVVRKSPSKSATIFPVGTIKKGNDGNKWKVVETKNGTKRWQIVKSGSNKYKKFYILDNRNKPFIVNILIDEIQIYALNYNKLKNAHKLDNIMNETNHDLYDLFMNIKEYEKVFIGKSQLNDMTEYSGAYGSKYNGNSILIKLSSSSRLHNYMAIGYKIYTFSTSEEIIQYHSPVGNNLVPYPYAISNNYVYLLIDEVYIENKYIDTGKSKKVNKNTNVYDQYYEMKKMKNKTNNHFKKIKTRTIHNRIKF